MAAVLSLAFFSFLIWFASIRWWQAWTRDIFLEGRLYIPMTIPWGVIAVGSALAVIVALRSAIIAVAGIIREQEQERAETS
jgi:TRAP-type C4-dicarboxylate transport system permease small subunit